MFLPKMLEEELSSFLEGAQIVKTFRVGGGCINNSSLILTEKGDSFFLKWIGSRIDNFFYSEATGLNTLREQSDVYVPEVITFNDSPLKGPQYILLELLVKKENRTVEDSISFSKKLVKMHKKEKEYYGFSEDNFIGSLKQKNEKEDLWEEFFFNQRILPQVLLGTESGWFDYNFERLLVKKEDAIKSILKEGDEPPCLVHGDLWGGNVFWGTKGGSFIDPAVYYGSREVDIAFSELFGGFDKEFYDVYNSVYPLKPGYKKRKQILNLYHLMTHANLFGGSYISDAYNTLSSI